jgi:hypothetical protein
MAESRRALGQALLLAILIVPVVAVYGFAASGPLRADVPTAGAFDMGGYIQLTQWVLHGAPADLSELTPGVRHFPVGYPCLIAALRICGAATSGGLMTLNLISFATGLWATGRLMRRSFMIPTVVVAWILLLTAASSICCDLAVAFAAEMVFLATSMLTLLALERATKSWPFIFVGLVGCGVSIAVRAAGLALIPALLWAVVRQPVFRRAITRRKLAFAAIPTAVLAWICLTLIMRSGYVAGAIGSRYSLQTAAWDVILAEQMSKIGTVGELFTNLHAEDFRAVYRGEFLLLGLVCATLIAAAVWSRRTNLSASEIYVLAYSAMLAVYPFFYSAASRRFWFPILPLLFGLTYRGVHQLCEKTPRLKSWTRIAAPVGLTTYVLWGCVLFFQTARQDRETDKTAARALATLELRH